MWHSEADIFKDLMSLDDSGKDETYEVLYSRGRGYKNHQKPKPAHSFVDSRTGEIIKLNEILQPSDICHKSRGRGNALSSFFKSGNQLQKQLRLARPLGSGDNIIEAFCRRKFPVRSEESTTSDSESDAGQLGISTNIYSSFGCAIDNMKQRVKATRNSKLQQNALINSLTSKGTHEPDLSPTVTKPNFKNADIGDQDKEGDGGVGDSSVTSLSCSFDFDCSSIKSTESNIETFGNDINVTISGVNTQEKNKQDTKSVGNSSNTLEKSDMIKLSPRISANFSSSNKETSILDENCQWPRNRLNREDEDLYGSTSKNFTVNNDFPPLRKINLL